MESILSELGAVNENENDVKRNILRERVLKAVRFPKPIGDEVGALEPIKVIGGAPELSISSKKSIMSELRRELQEAEALHGRSYLYEMAVIKLRIFQGLVGTLDDISDTSFATEVPTVREGSNKIIAHGAVQPINNSGRQEVKFMSLSQIGKDPGHKISSSSRYSSNGGFSGGGSNLGLFDVNLHVHGSNRPIQKWNIDDSTIDGITNEAKNNQFCSSINPSSSSRSARRLIVEDNMGISGDETQKYRTCSTEVSAFVGRIISNERGSDTSSRSIISSSSSSGSNKHSDSIKGDQDRVTVSEQREKCETKPKVSTAQIESKKRIRAKIKVENESYELDSRAQTRRKQTRAGKVILPTEVITCPICNNELPVGRMSAAVVLDRHIDRCTRRGGAASVSNNAALVQGVVVNRRNGKRGDEDEDEEEEKEKEEEDWMDSASDDNTSTPRTLRKVRHGTQRKSEKQTLKTARITRSRRSYAENDSNSEVDIDESESESDVEDPRDDFKLDLGTNSSTDDSEAMDTDEDEFESSKIKTAKDGARKLSNKGIVKKGKGKNKCAVISVLVESGLSAKDKKKADKLMQMRSINKKGIIEEDKVEVYDDWEDDFYLNRLDDAGISDFNDVASHDRDIKLDKEKNRVIIKTENGIKNEDRLNARENNLSVVTDEEDQKGKDVIQDLREGKHRGYITSGEDLTEIDRHTWEVLFEYQKDGIKWLHNLYESGVGGILGDEMGLGKTAQLCCHFGILSRKQRKLRNKNGIFLVVCPATVLQHWLKEFHRWVPAIRCVIMHTISKTGAELQQLAESGLKFLILIYFIRKIIKAPKSKLN